MDAIKKKMQAMKLEKDNALDRALMCEQQAKDANLRAEKVRDTLDRLWLKGTVCTLLYVVSRLLQAQP